MHLYTRLYLLFSTFSLVFASRCWASTATFTYSVSVVILKMTKVSMLKTVSMQNKLAWFFRVLLMHAIVPKCIENRKCKSHSLLEKCFLMNCGSWWDYYTFSHLFLVSSVPEGFAFTQWVFIVLTVLTNIKQNQQQYVFLLTMSWLLYIIHRHHCKQFSVELLKTQQIVPLKIGLSRITETLFL